MQRTHLTLALGHAFLAEQPYLRGLLPSAYRREWRDPAPTAFDVARFQAAKDRRTRRNAKRAEVAVRQSS